MQQKMDEIEWETKASVWLQALVYRVAHLDTPSLGMLFCTETMGHSSFCLLAYLFGNGVSCNPGWTGICYVAEHNLELLTLLSPLPKCWDDRHLSPNVVHAMLETEPKASCL